MPPHPSSTEQVLALRRLGVSVDESFIEWAIDMLAFCETRIEVGGTGGRIAWAPSGELAVVERHRVRIYSAGLETLGEFELEYACDVAFSPRGDILAIGSWESGRVLPVARILA